VSQKFADLRQRRSLPEHLTGKCMPELVGSRASSINPGASEPLSYNRANPTLASETPCGRFRPEKNASAAGGWPPVPQIISNGRADIDRQWQL